MKKIRYFLLGAYLIVPFFTFLTPAFSQTESITISTYYPSPVGVYRELRSQRTAIGDNYYDASQYCWGTSCSHAIDANADLVVEGNVGIGTMAPQAKLDVTGGVKIGAVDNAVCSGSIAGDEGIVRYTDRLEYCNGSTWKPMATQPVISMVEQSECRKYTADPPNMYSLSATCPVGAILIGCSGGPGDQVEHHEGWYMRPNFATRTCTGYFRGPGCEMSFAENRQRVIAVCAQYE